MMPFQVGVNAPAVSAKGHVRSLKLDNIFCVILYRETLSRDIY